MVTEGSVVFLFALAIGSLYLAALGMGMVMGGQKGVSFVNRVSRRVLAWPLQMLGEFIIRLARVIRG